ncbi:MAG: hypothetical protein CFE24_14425 [Flavobacterium sp. BFFFF2]|nr:MAG: hypothetical protein CFE24_14425 [Flavobacterium sp. BFFFF2]
MKLQSILVTYLFVFSLSFGQTSYNIDHIRWVDMESGLKQNTVKSCILDKNGLLWLATEMGIYSFDGAKIKQITKKNSGYAEIEIQRILNMVKEPASGDLFFCTMPKFELFRIHNSVITKVNSNSNNCLGVVVNNGFHFFERDVLLHSHSFRKTIDHSKFLNSFSACAINKQVYYHVQKLITVFNSNGSARVIKNNCTEFLKMLKFDNHLVLIDKKNAGLIEPNSNCVQNIKTDAILDYFMNHTIGSFKLNYNILYGGKGEYFLNINGKIYQINYVENQLKTTFLFNAPTSDILSIEHDKNHTFFLGTAHNGLAIVKSKVFNNVTFPNFDQNNCYSVAKIDHENWFCPSGWKYNFITQKSTALNPNFYKNKFFVISYNDKLYWANQMHDLVDQNNNKFPLIYDHPEQHYSSYCKVNNRLWISEATKIFYESNNHLQVDSFIYKSTVEKQFFNLLNFKNNLIIATSKGVYSYKPFSNKVTLIKGLENIYARYLKRNDENSFWVGCYGNGLYLLFNNKAYQVKDLYNDLSSVHALEEDMQGNLWISTNNGLLFVNKLNCIKNILTNRSISCYRFSKNDGLLSNEFNGGGSHPSLKDRSGIIGFPSMKGFVWFNPLEVPKHLFNGEIQMDEVLADGHPCQQENKQFVFEPDIELATFNFSYPYFYDRDNLTVEYKCADETTWKTIKGNTFQMARSKGGDRQLQIRIQTHGFDSKKAVCKTFPLHFEFRYYENALFWTFIAFLFVLLLLISYQIGLKLNQRREALLELKIENKTIYLQKIVQDLVASEASLVKSLKEKEILIKEIHHRVKNNLQLILSMLNIQSRRKNFNNVDEFMEQAHDRIASMILIHQTLYQNESETATDIAAYAHLIWQTLSEQKDVNLQMKVETQPNPLFFELTQAIPLGLIMNELFTNSLKYAFHNQPNGKIYISFTKRTENEFVFVYQDNGCGFPSDYEIPKKSFGLDMIHLLCHQLNGKAAISGDNGFSCEINFKISTDK